MSFKDIFTPKDTEEIKPNLFVQKRKKGYRLIEPLVWNGKWRSKDQIKTIFSFRTLFSLGVIIFLVWAYLHDAGALRDFYFKVKKNPIEWCTGVLSSVPSGNICTNQWKEFGLCETDEYLDNIYSVNYTEIEGLFDLEKT